MADMDAIARLEVKVDRLTETVSKLVLIEERQIVQGQRMGALEQRAAKLEVAQAAYERKVDQWINRGIGVWALALAIWAVVSKFGG